MSFAEKLKLKIKRRAHFACCLCHALGIEVHHIIPQNENGPDTEENAAPLCPSCHETYGANPEKRKFIREARDLWYEICQKRFASDSDKLNEIEQLVQTMASKQDLERAMSAIPARTISPGQRDNFLEALIDENNKSPKPVLKIVVAKANRETENFARMFKSLLIEAGYGSRADEIIDLPSLKVHPSDKAQVRRVPPLLAIFSSPDVSIPQPSLPSFGSVMMMNPSTHSIARGDKSHPRVYRYTDNPNDILYGICSVLRFIGIPPDPISGHGILTPGEIGFFIPNQI